MLGHRPPGQVPGHTDKLRVAELVGKGDPKRCGAGPGPLYGSEDALLEALGRKAPRRKRAAVASSAPSVVVSAAGGAFLGWQQ